MSYSSFKEFKTILTSAQLLKLHSSPLLLVSGVPNCVIDLNSVYFRYLHGTVQYNPAALDNVYVVNGVVPNVLSFIDGLPATGFVDQSVDMSFWNSGLCGEVSSGGGLNAIATANILGQGLYLYQCTGGNASAGADWTQGNGQLAVFLKYAYVELP
jgi:hypothetical protein